VLRNPGEKRELPAKRPAPKRELPVVEGAGVGVVVREEEKAGEREVPPNVSFIRWSNAFAAVSGGGDVGAGAKRPVLGNRLPPGKSELLKPNMPPPKVLAPALPLAS